MKPIAYSTYGSYEFIWTTLTAGLLKSFHLTHWQPRCHGSTDLNNFGSSLGIGVVWIKKGWKNTQPIDFFVENHSRKNITTQIKRKSAKVFGVLCVCVFFLVLCNNFKGDKTLAKEGIGIWMSKGLGIVTYWTKCGLFVLLPYLISKIIRLRWLGVKEHTCTIYIYYIQVNRFITRIFFLCFLDASPKIGGLSSRMPITTRIIIKI